MTAPLLFDRQGQIAIITLNRPKHHNALSPELICRLADTLDEFEADPDLRVAIITGAGDKSFCSGGDLEQTLPLLTGARTPETKWDRRLSKSRDILFRSTFKGVRSSKPIIAAINGHCLAGGFEFMLSTDIRIASDRARFGLPEAQHALIPFAGALARLPRQLPLAVAMEMLLTGDQVNAQKLYDLGLLNRVVPAQEVIGEALKIADRIAANGPIAISEIKKVTHEAAGCTFEEGFALETEAMDRVMATADAREGPRAFMEQRAPIF
jgi:enoyl-CoA hydratase